ncbi:oogenesis-related [Hippocampus comes]|uniref:Oogenesis-related gene n=1 Tax=Hippocampus comes TaxID=109280 RepID=A0A3Q2YGW2_HIPCM|nr:PREDICTED: uncharacterized protein LOC109531907 [Hippocampus comes]
MMATEDEPRDDIVLKAETTEVTVEVRRFGVLRSVLRGLFWPFGIVVHAYHGFWWVLGFRHPKQKQQVAPTVSSPARQCLTGRKRLHPVTRLLLNILPRWVQGALGYPLPTAIGRSLSPEVRVSPTKPCGKGSKRKQDDLEEDDDEEGEEHQSWVEALTQELVDEGSEKDPDYEPSSVETDSEEFRSHNNTESDIEDHNKTVTIEDVETGVQQPTPSQGPCPAL